MVTEKCGNTNCGFKCTHCAYHMTETCWMADDWQVCYSGRNAWMRRRKKEKELKRKLRNERKVKEQI